MNWAVLIGPAVAIAVGYLGERRVRGKVGATKIGRLRIEFRVDADAAVAFATIAAIGEPYRVDDQDAAMRKLVLSTRLRPARSGFLFPVDLRPDGTGTAITVSVVPKFGAALGGNRRALKQCVASIESLFAVPAARLVPRTE